MSGKNIDFEDKKIKKVTFIKTKILIKPLSTQFLISF